jgi:hypothetical protein
VPYTVTAIDLPTAPHATNSPTPKAVTGVYATDIGTAVASQAAVAAA